MSVSHRLCGVLLATQSVQTIVEGVGNLVGGVLRQWSCAHPDIGLRQEVARKGLPLSAVKATVRVVCGKCTLIWVT